MIVINGMTYLCAGKVLAILSELVYFAIACIVASLVRQLIFATRLDASIGIHWE